MKEKNNHKKYKNKTKPNKLYNKNTKTKNSLNNKLKLIIKEDKDLKNNFKIKSKEKDKNQHKKNIKKKYLWKHSLINQKEIKFNNLMNNITENNFLNK